jgi:hypothetical protein
MLSKVTAVPLKIPCYHCLSRTTFYLDNDVTKFIIKSEPTLIPNLFEGTVLTFVAFFPVHAAKEYSFRTPLQVVWDRFDVS